MAPVAEETADSWRRMFDTSVVGAALVARRAVPILGDGGIVLACSSSNTHRRLWGLAGYGATKAALDRLVEGLRDEHPRVRFVRAVIGPTFGTEFGDGFDGDTLMEAKPRWVVAGQQPATMMRPDDVAAVVVDVLATMRAHPGVEIPVLPVDPPGGPALLPADGAALQLMLDVLPTADVPSDG
jgi:NAD(P)-dependent dehydrogenase (short-subunit alcohol dehydrogenase family)